MSESQLPPSFKNCATCAFWGGARTANASRNYVIFESNQKGECLGGGFNRAMMDPRSSCGQWEKWPVLT